MGEELIVKLGGDALKTTVLIAGPMLGATLVIGLLVSIFQALTQINEATLTFIPKLVVISLILVLAGPWMMDVMSTYTINLFESVATFVRE
jgi:flagellar biosynthetic protein FliQ